MPRTPTRIGLTFALTALLAFSGAGVAGAGSTSGAGTRATCAAKRPTTFLVDPAAVEAGGTTRLLLWCDEPARLGFEGAFGPTGVLIRPVRAGSAAHAPLEPEFDVLGPDDAWIALPDSMKRGAYVVLVDDGRGYVRAQNLLDVR
jgi:hypothetical protein